MNTQVMLDLETLGTTPGSVIVAIGAVKFDLSRMAITDEFYALIDPEESQRSGFTLDAGTVKWWLKQSDPARMAICGTGKHPSAVLGDFRAWLGTKDAHIWGNGADFDNMLLAEAYRKLTMLPPWKFYNNRCYRTIKSLFPEIKMNRKGDHHNALDDAKSQADHLMDILSQKDFDLCHA